MNNEEKIDPLVAMQQDVCNMWKIDNQTKYVFYYDESNNSVSYTHLRAHET